MFLSIYKLEKMKPDDIRNELVDEQEACAHFLYYSKVGVVRYIAVQRLII